MSTESADTVVGTSTSAQAAATVAAHALPPARIALLEQLRDELTPNLPHGRALVAVDGSPDADLVAFADQLAAVFALAGRPSARASVGEAADPDAVRAALVAPFRAGERILAASGAVVPTDDRTVLVVDGARTLGTALRGMWHTGVWIEVAGPDTVPDDEFERRAAFLQWRRLERPHHASAAIVDDSDPTHPQRRFSDFC